MGSHMHRLERPNRKKGKKKKGPRSPSPRQSEKSKRGEEERKKKKRAAAVTGPRRALRPSRLLISTVIQEASQRSEKKPVAPCSDLRCSRSCRPPMSKKKKGKDASKQFQFHPANLSKLHSRYNTSEEKEGGKGKSRAVRQLHLPIF